MAVWRKAMAVRGGAEEQLLRALTDRELASLNRILRKLVTRIDERKASP